MKNRTTNDTAKSEHTVDGKPKKRKNIWQQCIGLAIGMLAGMTCGLAIAKYVVASVHAGSPFWLEALTFLALFLAMCAAFFIQTVIHETGHLVFGLLSGYHFSSFRIMSFLWIRENGRLRLRRLRVAGTAGQCLMVPPDPVDGRIPTGLYNLGGSLMNALAGAVFLSVYFATDGTSLLSVILLMASILGFATAILNGVPMHMGTVNNDGYNALSLRHNPEALHAFWVQLKANEQSSKGVRLKEMPDEWFSVPADEEMKNSTCAVMGVFACSRLMETQEFEEADKLMAHLLEMDSAIVGLHRSLMICDRIYIELITKNRRDVLDGFLSKEQKKLMKSMHKLPSVLRTEYAYALLAERDPAKAAGIKLQFDRCAKTYPSPADIQTEWELMELAAEASSTADTGITGVGHK